MPRQLARRVGFWTINPSLFFVRFVIICLLLAVSCKQTSHMQPHESPPLDPQVKRDIKTVVDYLWRDEQRHYLASGYVKDHIFRVLKRLSGIVKYEP